MGSRGRYPDIGDYALIGDSRTSALVSRDGSVDWMCLPNFDSPSMFARLLDWERGGHFQIVPEVAYEARRRYLGDTNVLETTFATSTGQVALMDFMPAQTEDQKSRELQPLRSLLRIVRGISGEVPLRLDYVPRPMYGSAAVRLHRRGLSDVTASLGPWVTHLRTEVPLALDGRAAHARFTVAAGARVRFALAFSASEPAVLVSPAYVEQVLEQTVAFWREWSDRCSYRGPYREQVLRSALTLKLLSFAPSGAIIAAPTTSLPEEIGGERNWDYRYCWLRDAAFTVKSLVSLGYEAEASAFVNWLLHATRLTEPRLHPLYKLYGEPRVTEVELEGFEGYRASRPVRIGNAAHEQRQFDVYGELVDGVHSFIAAQDRTVDRDEAGFLRDLANHVADHWAEPDDGIWEARSGKEQYTHSKVMAWDALTHAAILAGEGCIPGDSARWQAEAERLRTTVLEKGFNTEVGAFTQVLGGSNLDAAVLTMPLVGFIDPGDPRMLSTIAAIRRALESNGFVRRYQGFDDGLRGGEGAFLVCNFWLAAALAASGQPDDAHAVFRTTAGAANDLGLLPEEVDPGTGTALGNFPQGLSHVGLITAALAIAAAEGDQVLAERGGRVP